MVDCCFVFGAFFCWGGGGVLFDANLGIFYKFLDRYCFLGDICALRIAPSRKYFASGIRQGIKNRMEMEKIDFFHSFIFVFKSIL